MINEIDEAIDKKNQGYDVSDKVENLQHLTSLVVKMNDDFLRDKTENELSRKRRQELEQNEMSVKRLNKLLKGNTRNKITLSIDIEIPYLINTSLSITVKTHLEGTFISNTYATLISVVRV